MPFHYIVPSPSTTLNFTYKIPNYTIAQLPTTLMHKWCRSCTAHDDMMCTMPLSISNYCNNICGKLFSEVARSFLSQIREQICLDVVLRHISNMRIQSRAVLGGRGCREKKIPTAISMLLLRVFLYVFMGKIFLKNFKNVVASPLKIYML